VIGVFTAMATSGSVCLLRLCGYLLQSLKTPLAMEDRMGVCIQFE